MSKPAYHIYLLSRLAFADATDWQKILKELRQGRKNMFWSYKPLRSGAFRMASRNAPDSTSIYGDVSNLAMKAGGDRCRKANVQALQQFETIFLPDIAKAQSSFMESPEPLVDFGPIQLVGGSHFSVLDTKSQRKFVYLQPSAGWQERETEAFCELLTVTVESRYGGTARDVWFLDLREGKRVRWNASKKSVRKKCEKAAEFLVTLQGANLITDEPDVTF